MREAAPSPRQTTRGQRTIEKKTMKLPGQNRVTCQGTKPCAKPEPGIDPDPSRWLCTSPTVRAWPSSRRAHGHQARATCALRRAAVDRLVPAPLARLSPRTPREQRAWSHQHWAAASPPLSCEAPGRGASARSHTLSATGAATEARAKAHGERGAGEAGPGAGARHGLRGAAHGAHGATREELGSHCHPRGT